MLHTLCFAVTHDASAAHRLAVVRQAHHRDTAVIVRKTHQPSLPARENVRRYDRFRLDAGMITIIYCRDENKSHRAFCVRTPVRPCERLFVHYKPHAETYQPKVIPSCTLSTTSDNRNNANKRGTLSSLFRYRTMKEFLTPTKIAKLEHVTPTTVQRWVRQGIFPGARQVGREYRIPLESYRAWRESTKLRRPSA